MHIFVFCEPCRIIPSRITERFQKRVYICTFRHLKEYFACMLTLTRSFTESFAKASGLYAFHLTFKKDIAILVEERDIRTFHARSSNSDGCRAIRTAERADSICIRKRKF